MIYNRYKTILHENTDKSDCLPLKLFCLCQLLAISHCSLVNWNFRAFCSPVPGELIAWLNMEYETLTCPSHTPKWISSIFPILLEVKRLTTQTKSVNLKNVYETHLGYLFSKQILRRHVCGTMFSENTT